MGRGLDIERERGFFTGTVITESGNKRAAAWNA